MPSLWSEGDRMSEKKYLLTEADAREYARLLQMRDCGHGAAQFLDEHEHRERTCQMSNEVWADSFGECEHLYECGICSESTALLCCINENGDAEWVKPKFCGHCGARIEAK